MSTKTVAKKAAASKSKSTKVPQNQGTRTTTKPVNTGVKSVNGEFYLTAEESMAVVNLLSYLRGNPHTKAKEVEPKKETEVKRETQGYGTNDTVISPKQELKKIPLLQIRLEDIETQIGRYETLLNRLSPIVSTITGTVVLPAPFEFKHDNVNVTLQSYGDRLESLNATLCEAVEILHEYL